MHQMPVVITVTTLHIQPPGSCICPCTRRVEHAGIDVGTDPRAPQHSKTAEPADVKRTGLAFLHSAHCLGSGDIMVLNPHCPFQMHSLYELSNRMI